jgi:hypothetical protein
MDGGLHLTEQHDRGPGKHMTGMRTAAAMPASAQSKRLSTRGRSVSRFGIFTDYSHGMNSQGLATGWVRTALGPNGVIGTKRWLAARTT